MSKSARKKREGVRKRNDSKYYWVSYTDSSGQRVEKSSGTTSKKEATNLLNKWKTDEWNKEARGIEPDRTFEQLALMYLAGTKNTKRSHSTDIKRFRPLVSFFEEEMLMNSLNGTKVREYVAHRLDQGIANTTVNKELSLLSSAIKWCNDQLEWNLPNPVSGKRLPEEVEEARVLTLDEFQKLMESVKKAWSSHTRRYLPEFCILGFYTGMRPGELLELEWSRVSFERRTIELRVQDTKGKSRRLVALNDGAVDALSRLRAVADEFFPDTPWVFTHTKPRYFGTRIQSVSRVWESAIARTGIPWATPHSLRHTSATEAIHLAGANVVDISKRLGHKKLSTTLGYLHTADERAQEEVANLQKLATF